jgi:hypothetical protein
MSKKIEYINHCCYCLATKIILLNESNNCSKNGREQIECSTCCLMKLNHGKYNFGTIHTRITLSANNYEEKEEQRAATETKIVS